MIAELLLAGSISWTSPTHQSLRASDSLAHDSQRQIALRLRGQYPAYYSGIERNVSDWGNLRAWCRPDTVYEIVVLPGVGCSTTCTPGIFVVVARNGIGPSLWSNKVRVP